MAALTHMILAATTAGLLSTPWVGEALESGADVTVADPTVTTILADLGAALELDTGAAAWVIVFDELANVEDRNADPGEYGSARRAR